MRNTVSIELFSNLNTDKSCLLRDQLLSSIKKKTQCVVIDAAQVVRIGTSAAQVLMAMNTYCFKKKIKMSVLDASEDFKVFFEEIGCIESLKEWGVVE